MGRATCLILAICLFSSALSPSVCRCEEALGRADSYDKQKSPKQTVRIERSILYKPSSDGRDLLADVYRPNNDGPHPTILMIHGGGWFAGNKAHVAYHAEFAAKNGYAVMAINYRLAPKHKFPAQLVDCRDAVTWIVENAEEYGFDPSRLGVYGYSAGAQLASLLSVSQNEAKASDQKTSLATPIRAAVAGGTPCDFVWIPEDSNALRYWLGGSRKKKPDAYRAASPIEFVDGNDPPLFLFHGTTDRIVPFESATRMEKRLDNARVEHQLYRVKDASHMGAFMDEDARKQAIAFLDKYLKLDPELDAVQANEVK